MPNITGLDIPPGLEDPFWATFQLGNNSLQTKLILKTAFPIRSRVNRLVLNSLFVLWQDLYNGLESACKASWEAYWLTLPFSDHGGGGGFPGSGFSAFVYLNAPRYKLGLDLILCIAVSGTIILISGTSRKLQIYDFDETDWVALGSPYSVTGTVFGIGLLLNNRIALSTYTTVSNVKTYDFNGTTWSQVGNTYNIEIYSAHYLIVLTATRIAILDGQTNLLITLDFDDTDWSQVGNAYEFISSPLSGCALSSTRIVTITNGGGNLICYDFDGTDWTKLSNGNSIGYTDNPYICALSSNRIAMIDRYEGKLRCYDFNGTTWSQVGNALVMGSFATNNIAKLSFSRVVVALNILNALRTYDFDGTDWTLVGNSLDIGTCSAPRIAVGLTGSLPPPPVPPEILYASSHLSGNFSNPNNALGATDNAWAGVLNASTSATSRWAMSNPVNIPEEIQTISVLCKKGSNSGNPTLAIKLYENGSLVSTILSATSVTSTTGQVLQATFSVDSISNWDNVEIQIVVVHVGGSPSVRNSAQVDSIRWDT